MTRYRFSAVSLAALLLITTVAYAHEPKDRDDDRRNGANAVYDRARDFGYRDGYRHGLEDRRDREGYNYKSNEWKRAENGYDRSFGSKGQYKQLYRDAYAQGYEDGFYNRNTWGNNGTWGRSDRGNRDGDHDRDDRWRDRRDNGGYGNGGYGNGGYGNNGSISQRAGYDNGYQSGVYYGQLDRSAGRRPNPQNCQGCKDADRGYHSGYSREEFKVAFRDAFLRAYNQGYYRR